MTSADPEVGTKQIMKKITALLPAEARKPYTPTAEELRATYPSNYKGDSATDESRSPPRHDRLIGDDDAEDSKTAAPKANAPKTMDRNRELNFDRRMSDQEALMWNIEKDPWMNPNGSALTILDQPVDFELMVKKIRYGLHACATPA